MKKLLLFACIFMFACKTSYNDPDNSTNASQKSKNVQFVIKGLSVEYSSSGSDETLAPIRTATITSEGMTDLWVWEGTTLLKHQVSTDADFGTPTVSLTYGSHDITFVASKADGQTFSTVWNCTKVKDTFAKQMNLTVSGGSSSSRQVELKRRSCQVSFAISDAIPASVTTMHITASNHLSLNATLAGGTATAYEVNTDVSSRVGQTGFSPTINLITSSVTEEDDVDVMIEFLGADGTVLYHHERTISAKSNRVTVLRGSYFAGESNQVTLDVDWFDPLNVAL